MLKRWLERVDRWMCKHDMHTWKYTRLKALFPECGGVTACAYERHCELCGKMESGSDWF